MNNDFLRHHKAPFLERQTNGKMLHEQEAHSKKYIGSYRVFINDLLKNDSQKEGAKSLPFMTQFLYFYAFATPCGKRCTQLFMASNIVKSCSVEKKMWLNIESFISILITG